MENKLEKVLQFEGQDIKVITDKGIELFNLANSARVLGLTREKKNGTKIIRWDSLKDRLNTILSGASKLEPQYVDEIKLLLEDIDETDDRNSLYCSRYLTSRLAMESRNPKAMEYKNWLSKLDEAYSNGQLNITQQELTNMVSGTINNILPTMIESITKQFAPILDETSKQVQEAKDQVEDITKKLGLKNRNTQVIGRKLTEKESEFYGRRIYANSLEHRLNRNKLLNHFNVIALEDISIKRFDEVCEYVENMELMDIKQINEYKLTGRNKNSYIHEVKIS